MTRERADDYDTKKRSILNRAAELFGRKGFEVTTMADVAVACGTSKSHLYHYFPAKEDLLFAIVSEHITMLSTDLGGIVRAPCPAPERFTRFIDTFVGRAAESRNEHLVLMNELNFLPEARRKQVRRLESELVALMVGLLRDINPERMAPIKVRAPYAMLLFGMMIWTLTWYRKGGSVTPEELAARIADIFMNGFRADAPAGFKARAARRERD